MNNSSGIVGRFKKERTWLQSQENPALIFFYLCEATTRFALNAMIYFGKESHSQP